jgi:hypothetical protein
LPTPPKQPFRLRRPDGQTNTCPPKNKLIYSLTHLRILPIFIEHTKGVWYNTDNRGRPPKRVCGVPHAKEQQFQSNIVVNSFIQGLMNGQ